MHRYKIVILTSGHSRGSNFVAIAKYFQKRNLPVDIVSVIVTSRKAPIITRCEKLGVDSHFISAKNMLKYQTELQEYIKDNKIEMVVLAGFMKLLSSDFIDGINIPILNIHPALLPNYGGKGMYGMNVHKAVYYNKESFSGVTIHLVNSKYDSGKILCQQRVKIKKAKTPETIGARVLRLEHKYYGRTIYNYLKEYYV